MMKRKIVQKLTAGLLALSLLAASSAVAFAAEPAAAPQTAPAAAAVTAKAPPAKIGEIFPDANLAQAIAKSMQKTVEDVVTAEELETVGGVDATNQDIYSVEGMQYVKHASYLYLSGNHIADISPLKNFESVRVPYGIKLNFQTITLEPVQAVGGKLTVKNPIVLRTGLPSLILTNISNGGHYNIFTNSVVYSGLTEAGSVTFETSGWSSGVHGDQYSATVIQPYYL